MSAPSGIPILMRAPFSEGEFKHLEFERHLVATRRRNEGWWAGLRRCQSCQVEIPDGVVTLGELFGPQRGSRQVLDLCGACAYELAGGGVW